MFKYVLLHWLQHIAPGNADLLIFIAINAAKCGNNKAGGLHSNQYV